MSNHGDRQPDRFERECISNDHEEARPESRRRAIALAYSSLDELPVVAAQGGGSVAEAIIRFADAHGIPVHECRELVDELKNTPSGGTVPPVTFKVVAEIISFLYLVDQRFNQRHSFLDAILPGTLLPGMPLPGVQPGRKE